MLHYSLVCFLTLSKSWSFVSSLFFAAWYSVACEKKTWVLTLPFFFGQHEKGHVCVWAQDLLALKQPCYPLTHCDFLIIIEWHGSKRSLNRSLYPGIMRWAINEAKPLWMLHFGGWTRTYSGEKLIKPHYGVKSLHFWSSFYQIWLKEAPKIQVLPSLLVMHWHYGLACLDLGNTFVQGRCCSLKCMCFKSVNRKFPDTESTSGSSLQLQRILFWWVESVPAVPVFPGI